MTIAYVMERYVKPMIASGRLIMTIPEKPKSKYSKVFGEVSGKVEWIIMNGNTNRNLWRRI